MSKTWKGYRITSPFGYRTHPITGAKNSFHTGIDLVIKHLGNIKAFTAGKVLFAGLGRAGTGLGGYGNVVLIEDKNGRGQLYAHLHDTRVKTGQSVSKGQVIGRQGASGNVTGSHLHFEVRKGTSPSYGWIADRANNCLDPTKYIDGFNQGTSSSGDPYIRQVQQFVVDYGYKIKVDGLKGPETKRGLVKVLQNELNKQFGAGLVVDGLPGPKTYAALVAVRKGAKGNITKVLQALLYIAGHNPGNLDGDFGGNTYKAVRSYQSATSGLTVDGTPGQATWTKLIA